MRTSLIRFSAKTDAVNNNIVISGGGMVGLATACVLAKSPRLQNHSFVVLETAKRKNYKQPKNYTNRVVALAPSTRSLFESIGAWKYIKEGRFKKVKEMQVWEACTDSMISFHDPEFSSTLSYIVENDLVLHSLTEALPPNVTVKYETQVERYELPCLDDDRVKICMKDGDILEADVLIGADGFNSLVRRSMRGSKYIGWDYDQTAIVGTLRVSEAGENDTAWQRFLPTGPIALLPLTESLSSLVWSTTKSEAKRLMALDDADFAHAVNHAFFDDSSTAIGAEETVRNLTASFEKVLPSFLCESTQNVKQLPPSVDRLEGGRASYPLAFGHANSYVDKRVALVGDAAHRVHPLAGQGVNLGFNDVQVLRDSLENNVADGAPLGTMSYLADYETNSQRHNVPVMSSIHLLSQLYTSRWQPLVVLRGVGLNLVNSIGPLKNFLVRGAS